MDTNDKLIKKLNKIFRSKKFIYSLIKNTNDCYFGDIYAKMGRILEYYIVTRDENINYTYEEIEDKLSKINYEEFRDNIIDNGFMTHSFNSNKIDKIEKYGLDYMSKMDKEEKEKHQVNRYLLEELEKILGKSEFVEELEKDKENMYGKTVFICTPGAKTFHYACRRSPERLYEGPLSEYEVEPIIVGETKVNYIKRVLEEKINYEYLEKNIQNKGYVVEIAKKVVENYCSFDPAFVMLNFSEIKEIKSGISKYNGKLVSIKERINMIDDIKNVFSKIPFDGAESNELQDLVIRTEEIPKSAISIVKCMGEFEIQQIIAKKNGIKEGVFIDYNIQESERKPTILELMPVIESTNDLNELTDTYFLYKNEILEKLTKEEDELKEKYGNIPKEELKNNLEMQKNDLIEKIENILEKDYLKKEGINLEYNLKNILEELKNQMLMENLLKTDKEIKEEYLQYSSDIHRADHTRRVNFFATLILNAKNIQEKNFSIDVVEAINKTREIIETIVKNYNIARINDMEDKEYGMKSVKLLENNLDRIENFNDEQKEIIKFVIKGHSLSEKENKEELDTIFEEKLELEMSKQGIQENKNNIRRNTEEDLQSKKNRYIRILNICKDADKLDRVRLDPLGIDLQKGLDTNRLSLEDSKKYENVAYEGLDKITNILDIENELMKVNTKIDEVDGVIKLELESMNFPKFEEQMEKAKIKLQSEKENLLKEITLNRRTSEILEVHKKIEGNVLEENKNKEGR